jgi:hypothetical protein
VLLTDQFVQGTWRDAAGQRRFFAQAVRRGMFKKIV